MRLRFAAAVGLMCVAVATAQSTQPGGASDADLARKAKAGDGDAAFALAERMAGNDSKAALQMYALAGKAGHVGALKMLLAKNRKPDGKPIDRQQDVLLLRRLVSSGSADHHAPLRDASPETYWSVAQDALPKTDVMDRSLLDKAQEFDVTLGGEGKAVEGTRDKVSGAAPKAVPLDFKAAKDFATAKEFKPREQEARFARVAGYRGDDDRFHVVSVKLPEPTYVYDGRLIKKGIAAGRDAEYEVVVTVKNTGRQPIEKLSINVRCFQQDSPNNGRSTVEFKNVLPGRTEDRTVVFKMFNFQYAGRTSIPKVEVTSGPVSW